MVKIMQELRREVGDDDNWLKLELKNYASMGDNSVLLLSYKYHINVLLRLHMYILFSKSYNFQNILQGGESLHLS